MINNNTLIHNDDAMSSSPEGKQYNSSLETQPPALSPPSPKDKGSTKDQNESPESAESLKNNILLEPASSTEDEDLLRQQIQAPLRLVTNESRSAPTRSETENKSLDEGKGKDHHTMDQIDYEAHKDDAIETMQDGPLELESKKIMNQIQPTSTSNCGASKSFEESPDPSPPSQPLLPEAVENQEKKKKLSHSIDGEKRKDPDINGNHTSQKNLDNDVKQSDKQQNTHEIESQGQNLLESQSQDAILTPEDGIVKSTEEKSPEITPTSQPLLNTEKSKTAALETDQMKADQKSQSNYSPETQGAIKKKPAKSRGGMSVTDVVHTESESRSAESAGNSKSMPGEEISEREQTGRLKMNETIIVLDEVENFKQTENKSVAKKESKMPVSLSLSSIISRKRKKPQKRKRSGTSSKSEKKQKKKKSVDITTWL